MRKEDIAADVLHTLRPLNPFIGNRMTIELLIANKNASLRKIRLNRSSVIGRSSDCDLQIASNEVSRHHCQIEIKPKRVTITDLDSANGTKINGKRIKSGEAVLLKEGAVLRIGPMLAKVKIDLTVEKTAEFVRPNEQKPDSVEQSADESIVINVDGDDSEMIDDDSDSIDGILKSLGA